MNIIIARLLSTVVLPFALVASAGACHGGSKAEGTIVALSPTVDRDAPLVPKNHRNVSFYSARTQGEAETRVFVQGRSGDAPRVVYVDAAPGELIQVSNDGSHGTFRRFVAPGVTEDVSIDFRKSES